MTNCQICQATVTDAFLCQRHTHHLELVIGDLPAWLDELATTLTRQDSTTSSGGKATKKFEQPLPYRADAAELLAQARTGLRSWVSHLCVSRGLTVPVLEPIDAARWLLAAVPSIRLDERAGECVVAMEELRKAIRRRVDNHGKRWAGPCTAIVQHRKMRLTVVDGVPEVTLGEPIGQPEPCGTDLRTRDGDRSIKCPSCGAVYEPLERARWIVARNAEHMGTAAFLAAALTDAGYPVKANTISQWDRREKLFAWREDDLGRPMYRLGDVLDLVKASKARAMEQAS